MNTARQPSVRVVITGIGVVSPIGIGRERFWSSLAAGRSGIGPVESFDLGTMRPRLGGQIRDFDPHAILGRKGLRLLDRTTLLALSASKLALEDGGYDVEQRGAATIGCVLGSTMGSLSSRFNFFREALTNGPRSVNPALFPNTVVNSPASQISIRLGIRGFNTTISNGFVSSLDALEYGAHFIRSRRARAVLAGGAEELSEGGYRVLHAAGLLAGSREGALERSLPFDRRRNGCVFGEGSVMLLLESLEEAQERGARIYAEYRAGASATDRAAYNRYSLKGRGSRYAILRALASARVAPGGIDYVAAGANGHLVGDAAEGRVLQHTLGVGTAPVRASAIKSMLGETISAGGAFQAAQALYSLNCGVIPPTINVEQADPRCRIDCVPNEPRNARIDRVLVHTLSPMCQSAAAVLSRYPGDER